MRSYSGESLWWAFLGSVIKLVVERERRAPMGNPRQALSSGTERTRGRSFLQGLQCGLVTFSFCCGSLWGKLSLKEVSFFDDTNATACRQVGWKTDVWCKCLHFTWAWRLFGVSVFAPEAPVLSTSPSVLFMRWTHSFNVTVLLEWGIWAR